MRCVSYTRFTSNKKGDDKFADAIARQNAMIADYAKTNGFRIVKKYSDRKDDPKEEAAFLQMKQDGMERQFDCLIVSSFSRLGNSSYEGFKLLEHVFVPSGIRFIVVDEGFDSGKEDPDAVRYYLLSKRRTPSTKIAKREKNVFGGKLIDNVSGKSMAAKRDRETDHVFFEHSSGRIELEDIYTKTCQRIKQEKTDAMKVIEWLKSEEGQKQKEEAGNAVRNEAQEYIRQIIEVENERLEQGKLLKKNLISREVYEERMEELEQSIPELDSRLDGCIQELETVDKNFSEKNPWIKLYTKFDLMPLKHAEWFVISRRISKVLITDSEHMEFDLLKQEYRKLFPDSLFERPEV